MTALVADWATALGAKPDHARRDADRLHEKHAGKAVDPAVAHVMAASGAE